MSEGMISADLAGVLQSRSQSDQASTATLDGGSSAASAAEVTEQELVDITTTLRTNFTTNIENLQAQFTAFRTTVTNSNWDGAAKARANGIVDQYEAMLRQVAADATTSVEQFGTQTAAEGEALRTGISEQYQGLTTQFSERYTGLGTALQNYHDGLSTLDETSLQTS